MIIINNASYSNVSVTYTADGTQREFSFPFDYLRKAFVKVEVNEEIILVQGTDYTVSDNKTVVLTEAPESGTIVRVFRETSTTRLVSWADASVLRAKDMTIQQVQNLHILEEQQYWVTENAIIRQGKEWNARNFPIKNVGDPVDPKDATNKEYVDGELDTAIENLQLLADVVVDSGELQHITDQLNAIDDRADDAEDSADAAATSEANALSYKTAAADSAISAAGSNASATATAAALTNYLATKETLTAPAVDPTLTISGAAADAKVVGDEFKELNVVKYLSIVTPPITAETFISATNDVTETYITGGVQLAFTETANPVVYYSINNLVAGHKYKFTYEITAGNIGATSNQKVGAMVGGVFYPLTTTIATRTGNVISLEFTATETTNALRIVLIYSSKNITLENFDLYELFISSEVITAINSELSEMHNEIDSVQYLSIVEPPITEDTFLYANEDDVVETYIPTGVQISFTNTENPTVYYAINNLVPGHKYKLTYNLTGDILAITNQAMGIWNNGSFIPIPTDATKDGSVITLEFTATETSHAMRIVLVYSSKNNTLEYFTLYDIFDPSITEHNDITIHLPNNYYAVVGDTFELFYKGMINCVNPDLYYVQVICSKGHAYQHKFMYTPVLGDVGTVPFTIQVYDKNHKFLDEKTVDIIVKDKASSPATEKVVLWVGDSLSVAGIAPSEFYRRLTGVGGSPVADGLTNISMIGTRDGTSGAKYVAEGGRQFSSYNTADVSNAVMWITTVHDKTQADQHSIYKDSNNAEWKLETIENGKIKIMRLTTLNALPATGTLTWVSGGENHSNIVYTASEQAAGNPFWNTNTNSVDFEMFVTEQGKSSLDYVYVLLGWNSLWVAKSTYKAQVETFIENILDDYPSCKITILGLEVPSLDGLGNNYEANETSTYYYNMQGVWRMEDVYKEVASEYPNNVTYTQVSGQFDTLHNMQSSTRAVNTRNSEQEVYQTNGVHPATSGYLQIADVAYREFVVNELQ